MRTILLFILTLTLLTSCSVKNECNNRFEFISCNDSIPILNLDISKNSDTIRNEMKKLYGFDLCEKCSWVDFKLPFTIEGQEGYLKVMTDFDAPICDNCPTSCELRYYFSIMINQRNQLLVEGDCIGIDSLQSKVEEYLATVGNDEMAPETFNQVNFRIFWNQESNIDFLNSVLSILYKSHLAIVELELEENGIDFCGLDKLRIEKLKEQYPLRIEFDLGKIKRMNPLFNNKHIEIDSFEMVE